MRRGPGLARSVCHATHTPETHTHQTYTHTRHTHTPDTHTHTRHTHTRHTHTPDTHTPTRHTHPRDTQTPDTHTYQTHTHQTHTHTTGLAPAHSVRPTAHTHYSIPWCSWERIESLPRMLAEALERGDLGTLSRTELACWRGSGPGPRPGTRAAPRGLGAGICPATTPTGSRSLSPGAHPNTLVCVCRDPGRAGKRWSRVRV